MFNLTLPSREQAKQFCVNARESLEALLMIALVLALLYHAFELMHHWLFTWELVTSRYQSFGVWFAVGVLCSLYWPFRYRRNMKGHWKSALIQVVPLSLSGPFALLFGFPI